MIQWQFTIPWRLTSPNQKYHWTKQYLQNKQLKNLIRSLYVLDKPTLHLPATIKLTRVSSRKMDYDNLVFAFKPYLDILADLLIPNLKPGRADGDSRIKVQYEQRRGKAKESFIEIQICSTA